MTSHGRLFVHCCIAWKSDESMEKCAKVSDANSFFTLGMNSISPTSDDSEANSDDNSSDEDGEEVPFDDKVDVDSDEEED